MNEMGFNRREQKWQRVLPALNLLRDALLHAEKTEMGVWDFAIELDELKDHGLTTNDLRWLVSARAIIHATEISTPTDSKRVFVPNRNLSFTDRECFVLSQRGLELMNANSTQHLAQMAKELRNRSNGLHTNGQPETQPADPQLGSTNPATPINRIADELNSHQPTSIEMQPVWSDKSRELSFDGKLIKRFKWPAPNQELVVKAFEEQGWPETICDPLPQVDTVNPKTRLHDTIKCLNRNHKNEAMRFHGNGDGTGVIWRRVQKANEPN